MNANELSLEWQVLQKEFDSYEKHALYIKLAAFTLAFVSVLLAINSCWVSLIIFLLWGQEAIWKTYQARIEQRLVKVEEAFSVQTDVLPFQLNSEFLNQRKGGWELVFEYVKQAMRPTVAFPYPILALVVYF